VLNEWEWCVDEFKQMIVREPVVERSLKVCPERLEMTSGISMIGDARFKT